MIVHDGAVHFFKILGHIGSPFLFPQVGFRGLSALGGFKGSAFRVQWNV
jgi:hypothetical protein